MRRLLGTSLLSLIPIAILLAALPLSAQVEHADLGKLESIGATNRLVIGSGASGVYRSYDTNEQTQVQGLGSIMRVNSILRENVGKVVVVTDVVDDQHFLSKRVDFVGEREIRVTHGTITSVDPNERTMVLRNPRGQEELMNLGYGAGAAIDSDGGLLQISSLRVGQEVMVYFAGRHGLEGVAYLVRLE